MIQGEARKRAVLSGKFLLVFRRKGWFVADQLIVSVANFLTSAILARMLGVHGYGVFSIFYIILQYLSCLQISTIIAPMLSLAPQLAAKQQQDDFLAGIAGAQCIFSLICAVLFCIVACAVGLHSVPFRIGSSITLPYVLTIIFFQLQDWLRRRFYVQANGRGAFWNDFISYGGQIIIFALIWKFASLNINCAYYVISLTSLAAFIAGTSRSDISISFRKLTVTAAALWKMGRGLLVANQFQWLGSQGIPLVVAMIIGVNAAGGIRAIMTLMGPISVLYQLLDNVIPVRAVGIYANGGEPGLVKYLIGVTRQMSVLIVIPIVVMTVGAKPILIFVFGSRFGAFAGLVLWQGLYTILGLIYRCLQYYHRTIGSTDVMAKATLFSAGVSVGTCVVLVKHYGVTGAMIALVIGQLCNVVLLFKQAIAVRQEKLVGFTYTHL